MATETTTAVNTDIHIVKTELYDANVMDALLRDTESFSKRDLTRLSMYKRACKLHGNKQRVIYDFGKGYEKDQLGRLYVKEGQGLQAFPFDMRNPLLEKHYWDIDMENAHYHLLWKLADSWGLKTDAIRQYIDNRDVELAKVSSVRHIAKTTFLKIAYGGQIKVYNQFYNDVSLNEDADLSLVRRIEKEMTSIVDMCWSKYSQYHKLVKKKDNPKFSLFALILQTEERKCLLAIDDYMKTKGRSVDIYIHDGCEIRKLDNELTFPDELMRGAELYVKEAVGYDIRLVNKPFKHNFEAPDESTHTIDDEYAAQTFVNLCGELIQRDENKIYYFDETTGMWDCKHESYLRMVKKFKQKLIWTIPTKVGELKLNYGGDTKRVKAMESWLLSLVPDTKFLSRKADTSLGKLLFADGIYDFKTGFTEGFNTEIVFIKRIDRPYPKHRDEDKIKEVNKILFIDPFDFDDGLEAGVYLKKGITMALWGDYIRKKFYLGLGDANCSKGVSVGAFRQAFCEYVGEFGANELLCNDKNTQDESRRLAWLKDLVGTRIAFSSELRMDKRSADGNLIKGVSSGGDSHKVRNMYESSSEIINRTTLFLLANDFTSITPSPAEDTGLQERLRFIRYTTQFVDNPAENSNQRKKDPAIKEKFRTDDYKNALVHLIFDTYTEMENDEKKCGGDLTTPKCVYAETKEWVGSSQNSMKDLIFEKYEITRNTEDKVPMKEIINYLTTECELKLSPNKIGREMRKLLNTENPTWTDGSVKYYIGIKRLD